MSAYVRNRSIYGLAKTAIVTLTEQLALELARGPGDGGVETRYLWRSTHREPRRSRTSDARPAPGSIQVKSTARTISGFESMPIFTASDYAVYNQAKTTGGGFMTVRVKVFMDTTAAAGDAIGLFGLRLVPDLSP